MEDKDAQFWRNVPLIMLDAYKKTKQKEKEKRFNIQEASKAKR